MKAEELAVIKERAEKATDGPWVHSKLDDTIEKFNEYTTEWNVLAKEVFGEDAEFIANARQDVPKLVAEVERLQAILSECESLLSEAHDVLGDVHCYETDTYVAITKYFYGDDDE